MAPWPPVAVRADPDSLGEIAVRLARAMAESAGSVAVVTPGQSMPHVRAALAGVPFADGTSGPLSAGINLLDLHVVKGLEFDAVVVVDPQAILAQPLSGGAGALYTALTRSTRALAIVHAGRPAARPGVESPSDAPGRARARGRVGAPRARPRTGLAIGVPTPAGCRGR